MQLAFRCITDSSHTHKIIIGYHLGDFLVGCADRPFPGAWKLCGMIRLSVDGEPLAEEGSGEKSPRMKGEKNNIGSPAYESIKEY